MANRQPGLADALVIGASGGIGKAMVDVLSEQGRYRLHTLSRSADGFEITDDHSVAHHAASLQERGHLFSFIFVASGILDVPYTDDQAVRQHCGPEKSFREITPDTAQAAFAINALGPALVFKHFAPLMPKKGHSLFTALSARVGSIEDNELGGWMSYRASKAALNQFIRCAALEHKRTHPDSIVVALHPGTIETELTQKYARGRYTANPQDGAAQMLTTLENLTPDDSGQFFAYDGTSIPW